MPRHLQLLQLLLRGSFWIVAESGKTQNHPKQLCRTEIERLHIRISTVECPYNTPKVVPREGLTRFP